MHVSRIPLCALRCGNPRRIPTQYQTKSPILNKIPKRTLFWKGGSRQEPELVGADKHTVERFTPSDPRRKQRLSAPAPPLTHSFPGVPEASLNVSSQAPKTRITQLSNGVRVASEENYSQMSVVGLFVNTGTRFEDAKLYGSSLMLERMSFKVRLALVITFQFPRYDILIISLYFSSAYPIICDFQCLQIPENQKILISQFYASSFHFRQIKTT